MKNKNVSRRRFLGSSVGAAAGGLVLPQLIASSALGFGDAAAPSERIRIGLIGCGNHGIGWNMKQIFRWPDAQIVAVCDVDSEHVAAGQKAVDTHYQAKLGKDVKPCDTYGDFRELVRRKDLDVVAVCTPDHWHVLPALMAVKSGKDVICEKPLSIFLKEGRILADTVKAQGCVFQTASENRSIDVYLRLVELVRSGAIGQLKHIEARTPLGNTSSRVALDAKAAFGISTISDPPPQLNFDMWLGQAPKLPYRAGYIHGNFRWNQAFSGGVICDWGAHLFDLAQWAHDSEFTGPVDVVGRGDFPPVDALYNTPATFEVHYTYADGVTMNLSAGQGDLDPEVSHSGPVVGRTKLPGIRFEGTEGWIEAHGWRGSLKASDRAILDVVVDPEKVKFRHRPTEIVDRKAGGLGGEYRDFLDAVKSRGQTYAPAEVGHRTISIAHIGNVAMHLGRKLFWNPATETFGDAQDANAMLTREQRDPWKIENVDSWL